MPEGSHCRTTTEQTRLVRYQVLAANRRHFAILFLAVVAFSWSYALAIWAIVRWANVGVPAAADLADPSNGHRPNACLVIQNGAHIGQKSSID
jgi:hypothetical protein